MKDFFTPDYMFATFDEVTPAFLRSIGVRALLIDIDNTLAPYEEPDPNERVLAWFAELEKNGIQTTLISNNNEARVERFSKPLLERFGVVAYPNSRKPFAGTLECAMEGMGVTPAETAMLGDQILTDCFAGKHIGLRAIIVPPIKDKTNLFFRFKRLLERPAIRKYAKQNGYQPWMKFWKVKEK